MIIDVTPPPIIDEIGEWSEALDSMIPRENQGPYVEWMRKYLTLSSASIWQSPLITTTSKSEARMDDRSFE